jgi:SAM-dependent methyltransferase
MDILEVNDGSTFDIEVNDWWALARYREIRSNIALEEKGLVVDIGCGSGQNLFFINRDYPDIQLIGVDHKATEVSYDWLPKKITILSQIQPKIFDADLYLLMDVLEHIEKEECYLSMLVEGAKSESTFFLSVPAFPILWSQRDNEAGHYRRYSKHDFQEICRAAGLTIERCYYKFSFLFPPLFFLRKRVRSIGLRKRWRASSTTVGIILGVLARLEERLPRLPFGTSIVLVGRKN